MTAEGECCPSCKSQNIDTCSTESGGDFLYCKNCGGGYTCPPTPFPQVAHDAPALQKPVFPAEGDRCFIICRDQRRGPYLPDQIRAMWKNGGITADSALVWGDVTDP